MVGAVIFYLLTDVPADDVIGSVGLELNAELWVLSNEPHQSWAKATVWVFEDFASR